MTSVAAFAAFLVISLAVIWLLVAAVIDVAMWRGSRWEAEADNREQPGDEPA